MNGWERAYTRLGMGFLMASLFGLILLLLVWVVAALGGS
jgi:hypothetical protein